MVLVGAVHDADELDPGVRASFTHELDVALPTQDARETLIRQYGSGIRVLRREVEEPDERGWEAAEVGVRDAGERSDGSEAKWLASRTAGSSPADLSALLSRAAAIALARTLKEDSHGDGGEGGAGQMLRGGARCKVSREDVSKALDTLKVLLMCC